MTVARKLALEPLPLQRGDRLFGQFPSAKQLGLRWDLGNPFPWTVWDREQSPAAHQAAHRQKKEDGSVTLTHTKAYGNY